MYYDFKVKIPKAKGKIYERTIKGVVYINYEYDRIYKPDKKYNIPKRTTIGKKCDDDPEMMYPNPNFLTYFPDAELPEDQGKDARSSCLRIGTWIVIEKLMMESLLDKIISDSTISTFISQISVEDSVSFQNEWNAIKKKQEGQPVVIDKSYEKYFSLEYYHEGKEDQCFVCGIEKASVIEEELMEAVIKSDHSYAEIMAFIKGTANEEV